MIDRFSLLGVSAVALCLLLPTSGCSQKSQAASQFETQRQLLFRGRFDEAAQGFQSFLAANPNHHLSGRASFLVGKCYLGAGDLENAGEWFLRTAERFPESEEANKAKFKLGTIAFLDGRLEDSQQIMAELAEARNGPYTAEATAWLIHLRTQRQ